MVFSILRRGKEFDDEIKKYLVKENVIDFK